MGLLRQLLSGLSETTNAWERFSSDNGDINYFDNIKSSPDNISAHQLLRAIREAFETLEDLQQKLLNLEKTCQKSAQAVSRRLFIFIPNYTLCLGKMASLTEKAPTSPNPRK